MAMRNVSPAPMSASAWGGASATQLSLGVSNMPPCILGEPERLHSTGWQMRCIRFRWLSVNACASGGGGYIAISEPLQTSNPEAKTKPNYDDPTPSH